jgi:hypothetical protein
LPPPPLLLACRWPIIARYRGARAEFVAGGGQSRVIIIIILQFGRKPPRPAGRT